MRPIQQKHVTGIVLGMVALAFFVSSFLIF